jgi:hypothetical protein
MARIAAIDGKKVAELTAAGRQAAGAGRSPGNSAG